MTKAILNIWSVINKILTIINSFLLAVLFSSGIPEKNRKGKEIRIPLVANIILLIVLVAIFTLAIRYYGRSHAPQLS
ncbi:MAG TPA: hypothetical protein VGK59_02840 [Ohtaekwangia sp.]